MYDANIYRDIAARCGGDIYIGVVGPVRTGKSTFIKRFMEALVLPGIADEFDRTRARDELPQSAAGRTVMTTEPKFIPDEAVAVTLADGASARVRLIDCVGYLIPDVLGNTENGETRMVNTPWSDKPLPFEEAAENGTRRVIAEHSTIGMLVTTDGTIGDLAREKYIEAERRVASELNALGKPYAVILNSARPDSDEAEALAYALEEEYGAPVALVNCLELSAEDIRHIMEQVLLRFPVTEIGVELPGWFGALAADHPLCRSLRDALAAAAPSASKTGEVAPVFSRIAENNSLDWVVSADVTSLDLATGRATVAFETSPELYFNVLRESTGLPISDEESLMSTLRSLAAVKEKYDRVAPALEEVERTGYGIVIPAARDLTLEEPEIVRRPGGYGVRLRASAPSIHMIRADIETEINPTVGTEQQSEERVRSMLRQFDDDPSGIWSSGMFGKSLDSLVTDGLRSKLSHMPEDSRQKLAETLQRIINEGSGGLICIIL